MNLKKQVKEMLKKYKAIYWAFPSAEKDGKILTEFDKASRSGPELVAEVQWILKSQELYRLFAQGTSALPLPKTQRKQTVGLWI